MIAMTLIRVGVALMLVTLEVIRVARLAGLRYFASLARASVLTSANSIIKFAPRGPRGVPSDPFEVPVFASWRVLWHAMSAELEMQQSLRYYVPKARKVEQSSFVPYTSPILGSFISQPRCVASRFRRLISEIAYSTRYTLFFRACPCSPYWLRHQ